MANSLSVTERTIEGIDPVFYGTVTFSGTYATGGETLSTTALGVNRVKTATFDVLTETDVALTAVFNPATAKVVLVDPAGAEVANATSLTGLTATFRIRGI